MQIRPDDQVLDSFIIYSKIAKAKSDVDKFMTGYHFWVWKIRKEIVESRIQSGGVGVGDPRDSKKTQINNERSTTAEDPGSMIPPGSRYKSCDKR